MQGSAKKGTNIVFGSDYDYHILDTASAVSKKQMKLLAWYFSDSCWFSYYKWLRGNYAVEVDKRIVVALKMSYYHDNKQGTIELVPRSATYFDENIVVGPADEYFLGNFRAQCGVRVLKYLFSETKVKLKSCFIEDMFKEADGEPPYNSLLTRRAGGDAAAAVPLDPESAEARVYWSVQALKGIRYRNSALIEKAFLACPAIRPHAKHSGAISRLSDSDIQYIRHVYSKAMQSIPKATSHSVGLDVFRIVVSDLASFPRVPKHSCVTRYAKVHKEQLESMSLVCRQLKKL